MLLFPAQAGEAVKGGKRMKTESGGKVGSLFFPACCDWLQLWHWL